MTRTRSGLKAEPGVLPPRPTVVLSSSLNSGATGAARLESLWSVFKSDDKVLIVISADPDAIAGAVALKRLLWRRVAQVTVAAVNQVKRPDNLQLIEFLKLRLTPFGEVEPAAFTRLVMVDSQPHHNPLTEVLRFDAIIDHHPPAQVRQSPLPAFVDIRPDFGATATMMAGYLKSARIRPNSRLATALFYAIKTDTQNFVRQGQLEDMRAFRWLYPNINPQMLSEVERAPIARSSFKRFLAGLNSVSFCKNAAYVFLEKTDHADTLVLLADFLMQISGVNRALAAGVYGGKLVAVFRAGGLRLNVGRIAALAFSEYGSAGGHKNMARAEVPLENLEARTRGSAAALSRFVQRRLAEALKAR